MSKFLLKWKKLKRIQLKSCLTLEFIKERLHFAERWVNLLENKNIYMCFLDKKWFRLQLIIKSRSYQEPFLNLLKNAFYIAAKVRSWREEFRDLNYNKK